ncbi:hypothetical protein SLH49_18870 [Cognatiyoonia sp. IB215446]|uniref:hypothetical protein n=1 Tax=Cognatiyoonia sp. IB215446 TaxID=3097355 RepID=UPI002A148120|nr:hypothetical protein [Cognatiyoonia sp. IB215446]MDX8350058.1 hypothetical protein [Cognatiyoonia sp. IB215446]
MKMIALILGLAALAACGANGPPLEPNANVGLSVGSNGVNTTAGIGASNGTLSVGLRL